jgi:hypothetical protein
MWRVVARFLRHRPAEEQWQAARLAGWQALSCMKGGHWTAQEVALTVTQSL